MSAERAIAARPRSRVTPRWLRAPGDWAYPAAGVLAIVALWELAIRIFGIKPFILPTPGEVLLSLAANFGDIANQTVYTVEEILAGFGLSVLIGIPLALAITASAPIEKALYPLLVGSQVMPKIAIAPLFIVWFGVGLTPKVVIAFLIAFFPVVIDSVTGLRSIEIEKLYLARSMGASALQTFFKFRLPHAMPSIFGGLKLAITFAVTGAIVGEFIGADHGIGRVLLVANGDLDTAELFAAVLVLTIVGILLFFAVDGVERIVVRWHVSQRASGRHSI